MKKYLLGAVVFLFLTTVIAYSFSARGSGGVIDYIEDDMNIAPSKIKFSVWDNGAKGAGSLEVIGKDYNGKRIVLIARFNKNGEGMATYYKQGEGKPRRFRTNVDYDYNKKKKLATIIGVGEINFKISNVITKIIKGGIKEESESPECYADSDCGEYYCEGWSENYCLDGSVYYSRTCHDSGCFEGKCVEDVYEEVELVEECEYGCEEGECLVPEEPPEPEENHDVGLEENYDEAGHVIRIRDSDNQAILENVPVVDCTSEHDIQFLTKNLGDFIENVSINLKIKDSENDIVYENTKIKEGLGIGETTIKGKKDNFVFNFSTGNYNIFADISIIGFDDADLTNNHAERQVEVVC